MNAKKTFLTRFLRRNKQHDLESFLRSKGITVNVDYDKVKDRIGVISDEIYDNKVVIAVFDAELPLNQMKDQALKACRKYLSEALA
jgi:hypothetical protein